MCSFFFLFLFWLNKTFCSSTIITPAYFQVHLPFYNNQNPKSFLSHSANGASSQLPHWFRHINIQLPSFSMNAMEFQKDLSGSMMHAFGYFCILYRKRFAIYSNFTFLRNFNGPGLCSAKWISTIPKVWLLLSFIYLCFPSFLWIIFIL